MTTVERVNPDILLALDQITKCSFCKNRFNETDLQPKFLTCKHYFCLACIKKEFLRGRDAYCASCWNRTSVKEDGPESLETHTSLIVLVQNMHHFHIAASASAGLELPDLEPRVKENCTVHGMPHVSWCTLCQEGLCHICAQEHNTSFGHAIKPLRDIKEQMSNQLQAEANNLGKMINEIIRLEGKQQDFLLKVLDACTALKHDIESELKNGNQSMSDANEVHGLVGNARRGALTMEGPSSLLLANVAVATRKKKLQARYQELLLQSQLDDLTSNSSVIFDFPSLKQILQSLSQNKQPPLFMTNGNPSQDEPIIFLANYCLSRLYPRHMMTESHSQLNGNLAETLLSLRQTSKVSSQPHTLPPIKPHHYLTQQEKIIAPPSNSSMTRNTSPLFFFNIEMGGVNVGRMVIETRPDYAPKMVENFESLSTCERGYGYKGCLIFQCWKGESLITGDFEFNNGRGGYSIFEEPYFMPDDTKLPAVRGAVGMRRTQKRHDSKGLVGSQFRIILQDMPGFTAIFGRVVEGLELMDQLSQCGDDAGTPTKVITISHCGKM